MWEENILFFSSNFNDEIAHLFINPAENYFKAK